MQFNRSCYLFVYRIRNDWLGNTSLEKDVGIIEWFWLEEISKIL